ncbi:MAG: SO2930 family diheme c-type cytochrome [Caulobacter sp.]|nr:SO2930 family diheme c-type cytochrome [Caulobacter sp.]
MKRLCCLLLGLILTACAPGPLQPRFIADGAPEALADWGMVGVRDGRLVLAAGAQPYELNTPLFTDYAGKLRTVWMPKGQPATWTPDAPLDFPVGTVVTKTFFYPKAADGTVAPGDGLSLSQTGDGLDLGKIHLVETRVLVRRAGGWAAFPYLWNEAQTRATLKRTGAAIPVTLTRPGRRDAFVYQVPNVNQCAGCHATDHAAKALQPIGLKSRHLDREVTLAGQSYNQIARLTQLGYLRGAPAATTRVRAPDWRDESVAVEPRARAWLDINCGHCHSPKGPADTSGLYLDIATPPGPSLGLCKPPVAAGQGTGGFSHDIAPGDPDQSILIFRTASLDPGAMMPELGRSLTHDEGLALLRRWIAAMPPGCR